MYYENTKALKPSEFLIEAFEIFRPAPGKALDLGCGAGRDTRYLLEKGFHVTAVDQDPAAEAYLRRLPHQDKLEFICVGFEDFEFGNYELINAHYALPFTENVNFDKLINDIYDAINPNGLFVGQLFGIDDEWNTPDSKMTFCKRTDIDKLFRNFKQVKITEINEMGSLANGDSKHWHVFNIVAQK